MPDMQAGELECLEEVRGEAKEKGEHALLGEVWLFGERRGGWTSYHSICAISR